MKFYAKTVKNNKDILEGLSVSDHCKITGWIAEELVAHLPLHLKDNFHSAAFYAALHDVGKISSSYQNMLYTALGLSDPSLSNAPQYSRQMDTFHGCVTASEIEPILRKQRIKTYIAKMLAMHHGFSPVDSQRAEAYGFHDERIKLMDQLQDLFGGVYRKDIKWDLANAIGGLVIVADWLASGAPFDTMQYDHGLSDHELKDKAIKAVQDAGIIPKSINKDKTFKEVFGFTENKIQKEFIDLVNGPGVYILEADMGKGKTEAALGVAMKVIRQGFANGLYFALPTQMTSTKVCERVEQFCEQLDLPEPALIHGAAWLENNEHIKLADWCRLHAPILSQVGVGTIDQALKAVLRTKHNFIRDYGLVDKVVILDEVHSYDTYCSTLLKTLVKRLEELGCVVIILSATLTKQQKGELLNNTDYTFGDGYPMLTAKVNGEIREIAIEPDSQKDIICEYSNTSNALEIAKAAVQQGQQVLWIENTVKEAQNTYDHFNDILDKSLLHASFTMDDRKIKEDLCMKWMGKRGDRTTGHIIVGTQVLEQSLDIDADLLITRECPTDMFFQRTGRLWRHQRDNRCGAICKVIVLPRKEDGYVGTSYVYAPYVLMRSEEAFRQRLQQNSLRLQVPADIRDYLECTYEERTETDKKYKEAFDKLQADKKKDENEAKWASRVPDPGDPMNAETRLSKMETKQYVVVKDFTATTLTLLDGTVLTIPDKSASNHEKKQFYREKLAHQIIKKAGLKKEQHIELLDDYDVYLLVEGKDCNYNVETGLLLFRK